MESNQDRLVRYLQDLHALEVSSLQMIEHPLNRDLLTAGTELFDEYCLQVKTQLAALQYQLGRLGHEPSKLKGFFNGLVGVASEWTDIAHDEADRATMACIRYYATSQTKSATYEALSAFAKMINETPVMEMAQAGQAAESARSDQLFDLIPRMAVKAIEREAGV
ncbi:MAG: hypothetical protein BGO01_06000 [Armatimonadetes bacterium 55-13]|nr:MAG: hypothetical protein BGO01_06000 [Armatimonadetes bacterium 55-13]